MCVWSVRTWTKDADGERTERLRESVSRPDDELLEIAELLLLDGRSHRVLQRKFGRIRT